MSRPRSFTDAEQFARQRTFSNAWKERNREKTRGASLRYYYSHKEHLNRQRSEKKTGWSAVQYADALLSQNGRCAICSAQPDRKKLSGDHDHVTGRRRGLLCDRCNLGLGKFDDRPDLLLAAATYLAAYKE